MNTTTTLVVILGSNSACLFLGYLFGRLTSSTVQIEENMDPEDEKPSETVSGRRKLNAIQVIAWSVAFIGIVTVALGYVVIRNQDRIVGCVVGYSKAQAAATKARSAANNDVFDQLDMVMETIGRAYAAADIGQTNEARTAGRKAIEDYNKSRKEAKQAQRENPLPDVPEEACAELID